MIKFAIYEKDRSFLKSVCDKLYETISKNSFKARITLLDNFDAAMKNLDKNTYDVLLIAISETDDSGFKIAAKAREKSGDIIIVFGSESEKLLLKSMDYHPFNLVIKNDTEKMNDDLERITVIIANRFNQSRYISVGGNTKTISEIIYAKSEGHYLDFHCTDGVITVRENISEAEKRLCEFDFLRIHRQYLVNMAKIASFSQSTPCITLLNGETLPVSRANRSIIAEKYSEFKKKHRGN